MFEESPIGTTEIELPALPRLDETSSRRKSRRGRVSVMPWPAAIMLTCVFALAFDAALPATAAAARVNGTLIGYRGQPEPSRDLHFENCISHDSYLAPTHTDATFAQNLPPGCYNLRAERGAILRPGIMVKDNDVALGVVSDLAPFAPARVFDLEALFPTLLTSPAPSTAYIFTHDPTVVPASAEVVKVPSSESEWLKLQKQTEATTKATAPAPPEFSEPMDFNPSTPVERSPLAPPASQRPGVPPPAGPQP
jgi:hypothetical protein